MQDETTQSASSPADSLALNLRLTALWALAEAGLGGLMHAFQIPLKGILVSGFAVMCISLLAWFNPTQRYGTIVRAWAVVMAVKLAMAPHSPPTAYLAVTFQAFFSLFCFRFIRHFPTACMVAAVGSLFESAMQRVLLVTVVFGMDIWQGQAQFSGQAIADKMILSMVQKSVPLMVGYVVLHVLGGIAVGWLAGRLPADIERERAWLATLESTPTLRLSPRQEKRAARAARRAERRKNRAPWRPYMFPLLLMVLGVFLIFTGKGGWSLIRIGFVWLMIFTPFLQRHLIRWAQKVVFSIASPYQSDIKTTATQLPELKEQVKLAWQIAGDHATGRVDKFQRFVPLVFALVL
jgi:hypothetical protein